MNQNFESVLRDNSYTVTKICCPAEDDDQKRYFIGKNGTKVIIVIGLNPSIAGRNMYDNTVMKIEQIVHQQGDKYNGFILFNLSAQRSTEPSNLNEKKTMKYHDSNLLYFKKVLEELNESQKNIDIWVAFGDAVLERKYLIKCLRDFYCSTKKYNLNWYCTSKNKSGAPKHPLYEQNIKLLNFDMCEFVKKLSEVNGKLC